MSNFKEQLMEELSWTAFIAFIFTLLGTLWVHYKLVKHIYDKQESLEIYRQKLERENLARQKSQIVAELFSLWSQTSNTNPHSQSLSPMEFRRLNQLSYECSLWLPSEILIDLSNRLTNAPEAKDIKQILIDVRHYLNPEFPPVDWNKIIHW